jgi:hypothetical protein
MHLYFVHIRHITHVLHRGLKSIIIIVATATEASGKMHGTRHETQATMHRIHPQQMMLNVIPHCLV